MGKLSGSTPDDSFPNPRAAPEIMAKESANDTDPPTLTDPAASPTLGSVPGTADDALNGSGGV